MAERVSIVNIRRLRKDEERALLLGRLEDEHERERRLREIREAAEQENERHFRNLAIERRTAYLERVGYGGHSAEDLAAENFLYPDDTPPFEIASDGRVYCTRDGKPVTTYHQTLAEVWYWQTLEWGGLGFVHDEEAQAFYTEEGELAVSRTRANLQHMLRR